MSLINAKPRFAFDPTDNSIFDYVTSKSVPATGVFTSADGQWDAAVLAQLIVTGQDVNGARLLTSSSETQVDDQGHEVDANELEARRLAALAQSDVQPAPPSSPPSDVVPPTDVDKVEQANRDFLREGSAGDTEVAAESSDGSEDVKEEAQDQPA